MTELEIQPPDLSAIVKAKLIGVVRSYAAQSPRTQQVAIGASELGNPCDRALAFKSLGYNGSGHPGMNDPWAAFIGTSVHAGLEKVFHWANQRHAETAAYEGEAPRYPWKIEVRVAIAPGIGGTADLFDAETGTVIDHKVPADSTMDKARRGKISETYKVQIQAYGYGFAALGYDVRNVAIAFWPRGTGAWLGALEVITFPYEPQIVETALARWYSIVNAAIELDLETYPERAAFLATADAPCRWCPFFDPHGKFGSGPRCNGHGK